MRYKALLIAAALLQTLAGTAQAFTTVCKDTYDYACWYEGTWVAPDEAAIPNDGTGDMIRYGKLLLSETYKYLGQGSSMPYQGNKIACTNCHMDDGKAAHGQPWAVVWYKYGAGGPGPYSARSNRFLDMKNRIHDCMQRSMYGTQLPDDSYEMILDDRVHEVAGYRTESRGLEPGDTERRKQYRCSLHDPPGRSGARQDGVSGKLRRLSWRHR